MSFSIPATTRALATCLTAPRHRLACPERIWHAGLAELRRRGKGKHEAGAFLVGRRLALGRREWRQVHSFVYYDELDPHCLDTGIVVFDGAGYGPLWRLCRENGLEVVADVHTHPGIARQSEADRMHPMVATSGHFAMIVPNFAMRVPAVEELGLYQYLGRYRWKDYSGEAAARTFYTGAWA